MLKVLIVDDSGTARIALKYIIQQTSDMEVVGEAADGLQAVRMTRDLRPDVIIMDIVMPGMDGLEATSEIMCETPTPIVVVSATVEGPETETAFQAIRAGALTVLPKPVGPASPDYARESRTLQNTVRAMAGVSVIHHRRKSLTSPRYEEPQPVEPLVPEVQIQPDIIAIAASTGGPGALGEIVSTLPHDFPVPIVVVQHITADFLPSMVKWLDMVSPLHVTVAQAGDRPQAGNVYLAPGTSHLLLELTRRFAFDTVSPERPLPSGDILLRSVARAYGSRAIGIVLTGMGSDGADGLRALYDAGAFTIAQDEATSAVYGMPREAVARGGVHRVLPLADIPAALVEMVASKKERLS